jgi:hypothetical protein
MAREIGSAISGAHLKSIEWVAGSASVFLAMDLFDEPLASVGSLILHIVSIVKAQKARSIMPPPRQALPHCRPPPYSRQDKLG